ncbi:MAG: hypothetical protein ACR2QT_10400 [Woeseiaceae bacterium]
MHRLLILLFAFALPFSTSLAVEFDNTAEDQVEPDESTPDVFGDDFVPGIVCDVCGDPYEDPMDFVGVAYNAFFGDEPWLAGSDVSWPFRIYNLDGQWVAVWFENILFDMPSLLPDTMEVMVRFQNGLVVTYTVLQDGPTIQVGPEPESGSADCSCGGDGEEEDDYADIEEEWEPEESEPTGVVEIVDPDEDGEFPDFYDEL